MFVLSVPGGERGEYVAWLTPLLQGLSQDHNQDVGWGLI